MAYFEIRGGLRKLEFERLPGSGQEATCAIVEFVSDVPLAAGQRARITLGRHNGIVREVVGIPDLVGSPAPGASKPEYLYRLGGAITASHD